MEINPNSGAAPEKTAINQDIIAPKDIPTPLQTPEEIIPKSKRPESFWRELIKFALIAVFIILPLRLYVIQPFIVDGDSMDYTFKTGQYLIVDELSYRFKTPARGDTIIFHFPEDHKKYFIKRVIGLPNETVIVENNKITIKNSAHPEGFVLNEPYISADLQSNIPPSLKNILESAKVSSQVQTRILGPDEYFAMGDNRLRSSDSRYWGPVKADLIVGRPVLRLAQFVPTTKDNYYIPLRFISPKLMGPFPGVFNNYETK